MEHVFNWLINNKEWLFSGLGISVGIYVLKHVFKNNDKKEDKQALSQVNNQNVTVNVAQPSATSNMSNSEKKNATTLTIDGIKAQTNILFIDDDKKFKIVSILKKAGWKNTSFFPNPDVTDINAEKIRNAHIIFVDIKGVGTTMYDNEGLDLVVDLKNENDIHVHIKNIDVLLGDIDNCNYKIALLKSILDSGNEYLEKPGILKKKKKNQTPIFKFIT